MEKDYSLLRPFDLEKAKAGEAICCSDGEATKFIAGPNKLNMICVQTHSDSGGIMNIDELALKLAGIHTERTMFAVTDQEICNFARALISEYEKDHGESVAWCDDSVLSGYIGLCCSNASRLYWEQSNQFDRDYAKRHSNPLYARPDPRVAELEALSVTNIMIAVVPGDGSDQEVYAKSVEDVEALLSRLSEKAEDYDLETVPLRNRVSELEAQNAILLEESRRQWTAATDWAGKHQILTVENAALLVAIEGKDVALIDAANRFAESGFPTWATEAGDARCIHQSTELLEVRDRKRDAKLIRAISRRVDYGESQELWDVAATRESGEWQPEL